MARICNKAYCYGTTGDTFATKKQLLVQAKSMRHNSKHSYSSLSSSFFLPLPFFFSENKKDTDQSDNFKVQMKKKYKIWNFYIYKNRIVPTTLSCPHCGVSNIGEPKRYDIGYNKIMISWPSNNDNNKSLDIPLIFI